MEEIMRNIFQIVFFTALIFCFLITSPNIGLAGVDLPWSTTFNCMDGDPHWCQAIGLNAGDVNCDNMEGALQSTIEGKETCIESGANNKYGDGGYGMRNWYESGKNHNTGTMLINLNSVQTELWVRWYIKYQNGFKWSTLQQHKLLYFDMGENDQFQPDLAGFDKFGFSIYFDPWDYRSSTDWGWDKMMEKGGDDNQGHKTSDGEFHCLEVHTKCESGPSAGDGIAQFWYEGTLVIDRNDVNWGWPCGWHRIQIPANADAPDVDTAMYVDIDDISISNTGYIGPININGDHEPPEVSITKPSSSEVVSGIISISANSFDNVSVAGVQFKLDGSAIGTEDTTPPYSISWDTTTTSDGNHTLTATARDTKGNQTTSIEVSITVNNDSGNTGTILFKESFEDTNFSARGWYDNTNLQLSTTEHIGGSASSAEFHFLQGATTPTSGGSIRKKFAETDEIYVSYYVKYSANWEGSNKNYHPHEFMILTNIDDDWSNLAYTHLTTYIEQNEGNPLLAIQDGQNIDEGNIGFNLTSVTEQRSVAGCNGDSDGYGDGTCYPSGTVHWNGKLWKTDIIYFSDHTGQYYKNDWHHIEVYIKLNSISDGIGQKDGVLRLWYDNNPIINYNDVILRTGQHPNMRFNQFIIAPWIGDGSPIDQSFWVDNLTVSTSRPLSLLAPSAPTNLRIIE